MDALKNRFGFDRFFRGQREAIDRILEHQSTLLILPTGEDGVMCVCVDG